MLSDKEMSRYDLLTKDATRRPLSAAELDEWRALGERYAKQLDDERAAHLARREAQMAEFLAEKRAYDEAKTAHEEARAKSRVFHEEHDPDAVFNYPDFQRPAVERDFVRWLAQKGYQ